MKQKQTARVISQKEIAPDIYDMWIETSLAAEALPGQFLGVYPKDKSTLLPRPISICETDKGKEELRIVYRMLSVRGSPQDTARSGLSTASQEREPGNFPAMGRENPLTYWALWATDSLWRQEGESGRF